MRRILIASLLLSPMLVTAPAVASQPRSDADASTQPVRVSTGVVAPQLVYTTAVEFPGGAFDMTIPQDAKVVLSMNVDTKGHAQDIQVIKSVNPDLDQRVVNAVRGFRFRPATLDNQTIPVDLNLTVEVQR